MSSKVYFLPAGAGSEDENVNSKLNTLYDTVFSDLISKGDLTAIKVHIGEVGNTAFIPPWYTANIVDKVKENGGKPFITETATLYIGNRKNAVDHSMLAQRHGYTVATVGAPFILADGITGKNFSEVPIDKKHFQSVKIASDFINCNAMIVLSHFKGHVFAGCGGAIKNLAMGCASPEGKKEQHSARPVSDPEKCVACGKCITHCPTDAIEIIDNVAEIDGEKCIGCGECIIHCKESAININWKTEIPEFTERLTEYAYGAHSLFSNKNGKNKIGYINFVMNVTPDCDCCKWSDSPIVNDIGILASLDPVALDKACFDLVNASHGKSESEISKNLGPGDDKFQAIYDHETFASIQFSYGAEIGMGTEDYELIKLQNKK